MDDKGAIATFVILQNSHIFLWMLPINSTALSEINTLEQEWCIVILSINASASPFAFLVSIAQTQCNEKNNQCTHVKSSYSCLKEEMDT